MKRKVKRWKMWCGFLDGKPARGGRFNPTGYGCGLYDTRRAAMVGYEDVRRVTITPITRRKGAR